MRYNSVSGNFEHKFYNNSNLSLTLASTGAATFSSSVTVGGNVLTPAGSGLAFTGDTSRIITPEDNVSGALIQTPGIIRFNAGGTSTRMTITAAGNVGIGTALPSELLDIRGANRESTSGEFNQVIYSTTSQDGGRGGSIGFGGFHTSTTGSTTFGGIKGHKENGDGANTAGVLAFYTRPNGGAMTERMRITSGGSVAIGATSTNGRLGVRATTNDSSAYAFEAANSSGNSLFLVRNDGNVGIGAIPSFQLQLSTDSAAKPTSALWTISSDERIKENITPYEKGLNELMQINPIKYDYNGLAGFTKGKGGVGIIAQEIASILPDSVNSYPAKLNEDDEDVTEILNFNGHELIYVLINSIKELKTEIDSLKNQIK
jgi:hypothetical protein